MNTFGLFVYIAVIAVVLAGSDHSQHAAGSKPGDVVHWTTGPNSKGAATLNHTGTKTGTMSSLKAATTTVPTTLAPTTVATVANAAEETKPTEAPKAADATPETAAPVADAPAASVEAGKTEAESTSTIDITTTTETTTTTAAGDVKTTKGVK